MKEQIRSNETMKQWSNMADVSLTSLPKNPHTKGGEIFMEGKGDGQTVNNQKSPEPSKVTNPSSREISFKEVPGMIKPPEEILNPTLRAYATELKARIGEKPLTDWTEEELNQEYLRLHQLTSRVEETVSSSTAKEAISAETQSYRDLISGEYERRGGDPTELFLEAIKYAGQTGKSESVGAAPINILDYNVAAVQNVVTELNNEINRISPGGENRPLDPTFIRDLFEQVRNLRSANPGTSIADEANRLLGVLNGYMAESVAAGAEEESGARRIDNIRRRIAEHLNQRPNDLAERDLLRREIEDEINKYGVVEATGIHAPLLELASNFRELRESYINRILFRAFENTTETNEYRESMNLYATSNLDTLLGYLRQKDQERYIYFDSLKTAANLFHTMNATLIAGNLSGFINIAQNIHHQHFTLMKEIRGVSEAVRLFEQKYSDYLSHHKWISTEGYEEIKREVEKSLGFLNNRGLITSEFAEDRVRSETPGRMEEWELQRALNIGRTFFNITFRAAEQIASGQVPRPYERRQGNIQENIEGHKKYSSFPQESAARIMNWIQWMTYRFEIGTNRGGYEEFLKMVKDRYLGFLQEKRRKLGINKIGEFGGMKTEELEYGAMFSVSGLYSSWRVENMAFSTIKIDADGRQISIRDWLDEVYNPNDPKKEPRIARIRKIQEDAGEAIKKGQSILALQEDLLQFLTPLIDNTNVGLGILLKQRILGEGVGYKARRRVWERVAQNNLPLMINYLTGLKFKDDTDISSLALERLKEEIATERGVNWDEMPEEDGTRTRWEIFMQKVLFNHERNMKQEVLRMDSSREGIIDIPEAEGYSDYEGVLIEKIRSAGRNLAPHLADIVFPYLPFMNDAPFELFDYTAPGHEYYKRRGGDLPSFNEAEGAFTSIMTNPGGIGVQEGLKQFSGIVKGIESPEGATSAQENVSPMFEAWIDWIMTKPWQRQSVIKAIQHLRRKPTSLAQKYSDVDADSLDETQTTNVLGEAVKAGILNMDLVEELKKKKHLNLGGLIWLFFRDVLLAGLLGGTVDFGKSTTKGLDQR